MSSENAIERLRELLDERGVHHVGHGGMVRWTNGDGCVCRAYSRPGHLTVDVAIMDASPEQAIAATLGDSDATVTRQGAGTCQKVYLVETSDDLIESWYPIGVYLNSKAAGDCAEALCGEVDGIRQFARVVELKVVDE